MRSLAAIISHLLAQEMVCVRLRHFQINLEIHWDLSMILLSHGWIGLLCLCLKLLSTTHLCMQNSAAFIDILDFNIRNLHVLLAFVLRSPAQPALITLSTDNLFVQENRSMESPSLVCIFISPTYMHFYQPALSSRMCHVCMCQRARPSQCIGPLSTIADFWQQNYWLPRTRGIFLLQSARSALGN